ncbi:MAG: GNAT family N-acetyltransferase [Rhodopila sp.]
MNPLPNVPNGLRLTMDTDPPADFRAGLGQLINQFHARTVPFHASRFALRLEDQDGRLVGGLSGVMSWGWLFVDAVWVHPDLRGQGAGRMLMAHAEHHAAAAGCHSAWLDTFQARGFYEAIGYSVFGTLEDYPAGQTRNFLRKRLSDDATPGDQAVPRA